MKLVAATLAALLLAGSAYAAEPATKKPRVKPLYQVTVKTMSRADFDKRATGQSVPHLITAADADSCTVWVPVLPGGRSNVQGEFAAYRACSDRIAGINNGEAPEVR